MAGWGSSEERASHLVFWREGLEQRGGCDLICILTRFLRQLCGGPEMLWEFIAIIRQKMVSAETSQGKGAEKSPLLGCILKETGTSEERERKDRGVGGVQDQGPEQQEGWICH